MFVIFGTERSNKSLKKVSTTESQFSQDAPSPLLPETTVIARLALSKYISDSFKKFIQ